MMIWKKSAMRPSSGRPIIYGYYYYYAMYARTKYVSAETAVLYSRTFYRYSCSRAFSSGCGNHAIDGGTVSQTVKTPMTGRGVPRIYARAHTRLICSTTHVLCHPLSAAAAAAAWLCADRCG